MLQLLLELLEMVFCIELDYAPHDSADDGGKQPPDDVEDLGSDADFDFDLFCDDVYVSALLEHGSVHLIQFVCHSLILQRICLFDLFVFLSLA